MNKADLIYAVSDLAGLSKRDSEKVINAFIEVVEEEVKQGNDVQIIGFGTFTSADRAAREGRNPQTGEPITLAARRVPKFKPGKTFKEMLV